MESRRALPVAYRLSARPSSRLCAPATGASEFAAEPSAFRSASSWARAGRRAPARGRGRGGLRARLPPSGQHYPRRVRSDRAVALITMRLSKPFSTGFAPDAILLNLLPPARSRAIRSRIACHPLSTTVRVCGRRNDDVDPFDAPTGYWKRRAMVTGRRHLHASTEPVRGSGSVEQGP